MHQPTYAPQPSAPVQATPVVVQMAAPSQVGRDPSLVNCANCQKSVLTNVEYKATMKTHIIATLLCLCGCWLCVCIPYCTKPCRNAHHTCPGCNSNVGVYQA